MIADTAFWTAAQSSWMRFMLAHNGYMIYGADRLADLPEPTLGPHCFAHLRHIEKWMAHWRVYWARDTGDLAICAWLMKRILRSLFESQMMRINAFTRDIYPCAMSTIDAFPDQRNAILQCAELAIAPKANRPTISRFTDALAPTLYAGQAKLARKIQAGKNDPQDTF